MVILGKGCQLRIPNIDEKPVRWRPRCSKEREYVAGPLEGLKAAGKRPILKKMQQLAP